MKNGHLSARFGRTQKQLDYFLSIMALQSAFILSSILASAFMQAAFISSFFLSSFIAPPCEAACDANFDELFNLADPIYTLQHLFLGGPPPLGKFPECDETTPDQAAACPAHTCTP